jgi:hypothetical protein
MKSAQFLARLLLRLYPPRFRRAYGDEILRSLKDDLRDAESMRGAARTWAKVQAIADLVGGAGLEWTAMMRGRPSSTAQRPAGVPTALSVGDRHRWRVRFDAERLRELPSDVRYASRALLTSPGFTAVSILTVAVAIGAATSIFSIVNGVLLKPLPYAASDRLVNIWNDLGRGAQSLPAVHPADFRDYQAWSVVFEEFAAASGGSVVQAAGILTDGTAGAEQVDISSVTANFFPLLGVVPMLGRHFTAEEERPGRPRVAIIGHDLWQRRFGSDPELVGRAIEIDGRRHTVVGVLPPAFRLYLPAEAFLVKDAAIWLPLSIDYGQLPPRNYTYLTVFGRLRVDVTVEQAQGEMNAIAERLRREHPVHGASDLRIRVVPLHDDVVKLVLLVGAGLLMRSAVALHRVSPGFDADGVLTFRLALPAARYPGPIERRAFLERLQDHLRRLPDVEAVGAASQLPLTGSGPLSPYAYDEETAQNWESVTADGRRVSPDFFRAIGARLVEGRSFTDHDGTDGRRVIIIDDELARRVWPNQRVIGRRLQVAPPGEDDTHAEVIGVIRHLRLHDLARAVRPQIWEPLFAGVGSNLSFAVRTRSDPARLAGDVSRLIADLDRNLAISGLLPLSGLVANAGTQGRLNALLMLVFAGVALTLAAVGVYGVVAYSVALRSREFAIRQALGQSPFALRRMVLSQAAGLGVTAIVLGLIGSGIATRLLEGLLFDTDPRDHLTFAAASALLLVVVLVAAWVPARQATRVNPVVAFRCDTL